MPQPIRHLLPVLLAGVLVQASCSSQDSANSPVAAVSTTSAVVIGGTLAPVANAIHAVTGVDHERRLSTPLVYNLGNGTVAIANLTGWFTDRSELAIPGQQGQSAWVVNLQTAPRDRNGVIWLTDENLIRWFLRDHERASLRLVLWEGPLQGVNVTTGDRIQQGTDHRIFSLILGDATYRFALRQVGIE